MGACWRVEADGMWASEFIVDMWRDSTRHGATLKEGEDVATVGTGGCAGGPGASFVAAEPIAVSDPITQAPPTEDQPPKFSKSVKTVFAGTFGARTQSGIKIAKKPKMCKNRIIDSKSGRCLAPTVLKIREKITTAMVISVPCHLVGT